MQRVYGYMAQKIRLLTRHALLCSAPSSLAIHPDRGVNHVENHPEQLVSLFDFDRFPLIIIFFIVAFI